MTRPVDFRDDLVLMTDFVDTFCGEHLGTGISRQVFAFALDPSRWVVKLETGTPGTFQNVKEWAVWEALKFHEPSARWLAPCRLISENGRVLLQRRVNAIPKRLLPERVPRWATDLQPCNWGLLNGKPVMRDYGMTLLTSHGATEHLKKARWK